MNVIDDYKDPNGFLTNVVIPYLSGSKGKPMRSVCRNLAGEIIFATDLFAKVFNYNSSEDILGKKLSDVHWFKNEDYHQLQEDIRLKIIKTGKALLYINFYGLEKGLGSRSIYQHPIFMPNGEIVATALVVKQFTWFNPVACFNKITNSNADSSIKIDHEISEKLITTLSEREYEILFLLSIGLTQDEVAIFMSMSRSNITKLINRSICPMLQKFNLTPQSIINHAFLAPTTLARPRIVIIPTISIF